MTMKIRYSFVSVLTAAVLLLASGGCHHPGDKYPEEHPEPWTPSEIENVLGGEDPMENFNRAMFSCTDFLMCYVADPLGRVYTTIFPRPFITHFNNVCENLEYPARLISSLLQAEWEAAGTETIRFLANSTLGIAGIFDVAMAWWHIPQAEADFGQAFARWGIGPGETFILPVVPSLNGRDLTGFIFDMAFDGKTYIPYAGYATFLNRMVIAQHGYEKVAGGAIDPYKNYRQMMLVRRELELQMWFYREIRRQVAEFREKAGLPAEPPPEAPAPEAPAWLKANYTGLKNYFSQDSITDSMRVGRFQPQQNNDFWYMPLSLFNSDFLTAARIRKIQLAPEREKLPYAFWPAPEVPEDAPAPPEKLVILLPGIGGSCTTGTLTALAERFHLAGFAAVSIDSTFSWRFVAADGKGLPGFLPDDAVRVRAALAEVLKDLKRREWIKAPQIVLCGYSMGALHTLKIAELENREPQLNISRFIAVNPPVSSAYALKQIDALNAVSANWSKSEMRSRLTSAAGNLLMQLAKPGCHFDPEDPKADPRDYQVPLDRDTAHFAVGLSLKLSMREMLLALHRENPFPELPPYSWGRRNSLYLALDKITFADYTGLLKKQYPEQDIDELFRRSDLRSMEQFLRNSPDITVFHNLDDFLLHDSDRRWLDETLQKRLTWFSGGGHLGNLYYLPVHEAIVRQAQIPAAE